MVDPLAAWWRHSVELETYLGSGPYGDEWGTPLTYMAAIDDKARQVVDSAGVELVADTTVVFPAHVGYIRPGSKVTLPATHGSRSLYVIACRVAHGGGMPTPDHVEVNLGNRRL